MNKGRQKHNPEKQAYYEYDPKSETPYRMVLRIPNRKPPGSRRSGKQ